MNYVTELTADALRKAGFPQPKMAAGQVWYSPRGETLFCISGTAAISTASAIHETADPVKDGWTFAPTVADILRLCPELITDPNLIATAWIIDNQKTGESWNISRTK